MHLFCRYILSIMLMVSLLPWPVMAAVKKAQAEQSLESLEAALAAQPENLDLLFKYAQRLAAKGKLQKAADTLEKMLALRDGLDRVKLDLALVYMRMGKYKEAETLFDEVLATDPPENVRQNIEKVRARTKAAQERHHFSGSVSMGLHRDSNANSSSSTGQVLFADLVLTLDPSSQEQKDTQFYSSLTFKHRYRMNPPRSGGRLWWESQANLYRSEQPILYNLNLGLFSMRTGPKLMFDAIPANVSLGFGYNYVTLNRNKYLTTQSLDLTYEHRLTPQMQLTGQALVEDRSFYNAPGISVYDDRSGNASQLRLNLNYAFTPKIMTGVGLTLRRENTEQGYFDNEQIILQGTYTHMLPKDFFVTLQGTYRWADYDEVDPFVSATTFRHDREKTVNLTVGKKLLDDLIWTVGYQERHVDSSIVNYAFFNRRFSTGLTWNF